MAELIYTNGLNMELILPILTGRRGWRQPTDATFDVTLSTAAKECKSGRYYNLEHAACSPVRIYNNQEDAAITESNFNAFLVQLKEQVALESLMSVFTSEDLIEGAKILYEKQIRSDYQPINNAGKFCGWQVRVAGGEIATRIDSFQFLFDAPCTVTMYVFSDIVVAPIWEQEFTITAGYSQQVENVTNLILSRLNDQYKGSMLYVGYFQDEIEVQGVKALNVFLNFWERFNCVGYQGFEAVSDYDNLTFQRNTFFSNYRTYGVNLEMSSYRDHTNNVCRSPNIFDELQGLVMQQKCISLAMNSPRTNGDNRESRERYEMMYNEIEGLKGGEGIPYRRGLKDRIITEVKKITETFNECPEPMYLIPPVRNNTFFDYAGTIRRPV